MAGNVAGAAAVVQAITEMLKAHLATELAAVETALGVSYNIAAPHETLGYSTDMTAPPHNQTNWIAVDVDKEEEAEQYINYNAPIDEDQEHLIRWTFNSQHLEELGGRRQVMTRAVQKILREQWYTHNGNAACILKLTTKVDHRELSRRLAGESVPGFGSGGPRTGNNIDAVTIRAFVKQRVSNVIA